jgi:hypothetical protein
MTAGNSEEFLNFWSQSLQARRVSTTATASIVRYTDIYPILNGPVAEPHRPLQTKRESV